MNDHGDFSMSTDIPTVGDLLRQAGYYTAYNEDGQLIS
jgi:arylsulfatase A-like enzyme